MNERLSIAGLLREERSGARPAAAPRTVRRLHASRRGSVSVLFLCMGFVFFCAAAMVWNTGQTVSAKMRVQTAADTAAYSSAVWTSRAVNVTTATNMLIYRNASALPIAMAANATMVGVPIVYAIRFVIAMIRVAATSFTDWSAVINWAKSVALELPMFLVFLSEAIPAAPAQALNYRNKVGALFALQKRIINAVPDLVDEQRLVVEDDCDCRIRLTRPGYATPGLVKPPLVQGNRLTILPVILMHFPADYKGWNICEWGKISADSKFASKLLGGSGGGTSGGDSSGGDKSGGDKSGGDSSGGDKSGGGTSGGGTSGGGTSGGGTSGSSGKTSKPKKGSGSCSKPLHLGRVKYGFAKVWWYVGLAAGFAWLVADPPEHHVLTTQWGPFELGPSRLSDWREFTVVATATTDLGDRLIAPGVFGHPVPVTAYAQAETYNAVDQRLLYSFGVPIPYSFRVWTEWGWKWESRLTLGDQLKTAVQNDSQLQTMFSSFGIEARDVDPLAFH